MSDQQGSRGRQIASKVLSYCFFASVLIAFAGATREILRLCDFIFASQVPYGPLGGLLGLKPTTYSGGYKWPLSLDWGWAALILPWIISGMASDLDKPNPPPKPAIANTEERRKPLRLPAWVWPRRRVCLTTVTRRLGRVVHWGFVIVAVTILLLGFVIFISDIGRSDDLGLLFGFTVAAFSVALLGRAALYVLADE
jgi:hypothetical protein